MPAEVRCEFSGEVWCEIWFETWNLCWEISGEVFGKAISTCQESTRNFGANFGARFGEKFGNFASNFAPFFGNFVQQKGGAKSLATPHWIHGSYAIFNVCVHSSRGSKFDPHPQPQISLVRISVCDQVSNGNSYWGEPGRGRNGSHCSFQAFHSLTKENQVSLVRTFLSDPGSESKNTRLGGWGWKDDPDFRPRHLSWQPLVCWPLNSRRCVWFMI